MPRTSVDYSKIVIYKIQHKENPELIYIGSSTNFTKRKNQHKSSCNNENDKKYNSKVYQMIRDNGGWECFNMIEIKKYPCNDNNEARAEEDRIMLEMKSIMNSRRAYRTDYQYRIDNKEKIKEFRKQSVVCECGCEIQINNLAKHRKRKKHIDLMNSKCL